MTDLNFQLQKGRQKKKTFAAFVTFGFINFRAAKPFTLTTSQQSAEIFAPKKHLHHTSCTLRGGLLARKINLSLSIGCISVSVVDKSAGAK